ncbi:hypothetical protein Tco_0788386 [Tanacetum coccineum]
MLVQIRERDTLESHDHSNEPSSSKLVPNVSPPTNNTNSSQQELDFLFSLLFEEYFTEGNQKPITPTRTVHVEENNTNQAADAQFVPYEFFNPFCTPVQEVVESSSRNVDNSNMHTFYQHHQSDYRWTKDRLLEQVRGNPSKPVQTRRKLAIDPANLRIYEEDILLARRKPLVNRQKPLGNLRVYPDVQRFH